MREFDTVNVSTPFTSVSTRFTFGCLFASGLGDISPAAEFSPRREKVVFPTSINESVCAPHSSMYFSCTLLHNVTPSMPVGGIGQTLFDVCPSQHSTADGDFLFFPIS